MMTEIKNGSIKLIRKDNSTDAHIHIDGRWFIFGIVDKDTPEYILPIEEFKELVNRMSEVIDERD